MDVESLAPEAGNLKGFIEQFEVFARAPGGVEKLREIVLQLAIMGRLVENNDDSSELLLKSLVAKKEELIKLKIIKRVKSLGEITDDEKKFNIPKNWVWARASDVFDIRDGTHDSPKYQESGYPLVTSKNIYTGKLDLTNVKYISESDHLKISERSKVDKGDILFAMIGSIGNPVIIDIEPVFSVKNVGLFKYYNRDESVPEFLLLYLKLASVWMKDEASGAVQSFVSLGTLRAIPFPLPPLEEQKRIVAKVDELMTLCDKLEAQQQQQAQTVLRANTAAINALLNPAPKESKKSQKTSEIVPANTPETTFEQNWQRIAQHFNTLYGCTLPMPKGEGRKKKHLVGLENVRSLRQLILQMSCSGLLIDSSKFPDSRDDLIKLGIDKFDNENFGVIPENWCWVKLNELSEFITSGSRGWKKFFSNKGDTFIRSQDIKHDKLFCEDKAYVSLPENIEGKRTRVSDGNILITITGANVGKCALISGLNEKAYVSQHVALVRLISTDYAIYLHKWLTNEFGGRFILVGDSYGDKPGLNLKQIGALPVPFPSIEEQKHIVAKVDQLMTLCNQLEQQLIQSYSDAEKLMQGTVKALVA